MEHLHHFNLGQDPFQNEPDLKFYCASETHHRAQLRLDRSLRQSKGLVLLVGEGGTGKSLLARRMFEELEEEMFETSLLIMMQGTADASSLLRRYCAQLGLEDPPSDRAGLLGALYEQLAIVREDGRHAVLIVDDAHVLGRDELAEIAGLLNLEYEDRRLLSLLLVGTPELDDIVADVPALGERVDVRVRIQPLSEAEAGKYLAHRVLAAGGNPGIFEEGAQKAIFSLGGGRPRRLNTLADNALFEAFLAGHAQVSEDDVLRAGAELSFERSEPVAMPQPATASASAPAPSMTPPVEPMDAATPDEAPFAAATELAFEPVGSADDSLDSYSSSPDPGLTLPPAQPLMPEPDGAHAMPGATAAAPEAARADEDPLHPGMPELEPQPTQLIDAAAEPDPFSLSSSSVDLSSLLGSDDSAGGLSLSGLGESTNELSLDSPIALEDSAGGTSFPDFTARNSGNGLAEPTRLALPDDDAPAADAPPADATDADEIDDLFVELLDD